MFTEMPPRGQDLVESGLERIVKLRSVVTDPGRRTDARRGSAGPAAVEPALPILNDLLESVAYALRDVEALRYAMLSLIPEPDRAVAVRLIQRRYGISARRARRILGLPQRSEVSL